MKLIPYIIFDGNAQDAIDFYEKILKASPPEIMRYSTGEGFDIPADYENKVMHAELTFGDNILYFCDNFPGKTTTVGDQISLHLMIETDEELTELFDALSLNATNIQPIKEEFWGAKFGSLDDQFGIHWSLNFQLPQ